MRSYEILLSLMKTTSQKLLKAFLCFAVFAVISYGAVRLYYKVTGGFTIGNISSEISYDTRWDVNHHLDLGNLNAILGQEFTYLGKGCQSYVFQSSDGKYVLKFFKYQRFRPQFWIDWFTFIPSVNTYKEKKKIEKKKKLDAIYRSWKIAYEDLPDSTGVVFLHLNKTDHLNQTLTIRDKMGFLHHLNADHFEFMVQFKAGMLCQSLQELMKVHKEQDAKQILDELVSMILSEYQHGLADNDHALMQNTGVYEGKPIHIDVGQFIKNSTVKDPTIYKKELFNKTYKFRKWLEKKFPELASHLELRLVEYIGEEFFTMQPYFHQGGVAKIPHQEQG